MYETCIVKSSALEIELRLFKEEFLPHVLLKLVANLPSHTDQWKYGSRSTELRGDQCEYESWNAINSTD
jgi:hypothetical protein